LDAALTNHDPQLRIAATKALLLIQGARLPNDDPAR
jgi:hypothetical protein